MGLLSFARRGTTTLNVSTASFTVQGAQHREAGIPNQDRVFVYQRDFTPFYHNSNGAISYNEVPSNAVEGAARVEGVYALGMFDGHGAEGHVAAELACTYMEGALDRLFTEEVGAEAGVPRKVAAPAVGSLQMIAEKAFAQVAKLMEAEKCARGSGTTASIVLVRGPEVCIAHAGDSCAVYVNQQGKKQWISRYVTKMHRPGMIEREDERVRKAGGLLVDGYVVDKVSKRKGISVTRTLGDVDMKINGCLSTPDIATFAMNKNDRAIVIATDGLWDTDGVLLKDVMQSVSKSASTSKEACTFLGNLVQSKTRTGPTDDCTIACLKFHR